MNKIVRFYLLKYTLKYNFKIFFRIILFESMISKHKTYMNFIRIIFSKKIPMSYYYLYVGKPGTGKSYTLKELYN